MNPYSNQNEEILYIDKSFTDEPWLNSPRIDALRQVRNIEAGSNIYMWYTSYNISSWLINTSVSWLPFQPTSIKIESVIQFTPWSLRWHSTGYYFNGANKCIYWWLPWFQIGDSFGNYSIYHIDNTNGIWVYWRITSTQPDWFTFFWDFWGGSGLLHIIYTAHK